MIRLTLNAQSDPEIHLFNKSIILLGAEATQVDLLLSGSNIQPIHLKIIEQNGFPVLINHANDPFVLINGQSFGKKLLNSGDTITVHQSSILFEHLVSSDPLTNDLPFSPDASALKNLPLEQQAIQEQSSSLNNRSFFLPFEKEIDGFKDEEIKQLPLDNYLKNDLSSSAPPKEQKKPTSLKDDYLRDLDDDNNLQRESPFNEKLEPSHLYQAWKWILLFIFSIITISAIIGTILYFSVSDKKEAQETKAAQGVADIAIALTFAQLNQLKPHNHNWSDIEFLKNNLQSILTDTSSHASQLDAQGQFNCCPYSLRIYTSSDLSHFLLIAQPAPNLLYWLVPQSIIVVDSHLMELRTLKEIRNLNRLLANADPLDGMNGKEITQLIKQGELIRLNSLANDSGHLDFAPPKNLGWVRPGAENLIYNAPRYFRLGQNILQKAVNLSTSKGSSQEVTVLKQEVEHFHWLHHLILYSDQGKKSALLARQGVSMFAPSDKLLFGYLLFNAQGKIYQVHLIKDDDEWKEPIASSSSKEKENELVAFQPSSEIQDNEETKNADSLNVDQNHPIYIQLQALVTARENELKPAINELIDFINHDLKIPRSQFQTEFQNLSHAYVMINAKHKQSLKEHLDLLYHQYEDIPIHQFLAFIKELNLEQLIQQDEQSISIINENCQQNMETLLTQIKSSKSLTELDNFVHIACTWLNFDYIKDPHELMKYQNLLRNQLLKQIEDYLFSQKKCFLVKAEDKEVLQDILNQERLIKPEERDYFLEEFDEILNSQQPVEPESEEEKEAD